MLHVCVQSTCVYIVALGGGNVAEVSIIDIFVTAVRYKSANVVIAHNHTSNKKPVPSEQDIDFTNKLFHRSKYLELNLLDHIIISRLSIKSKRAIYYSFLEKKYIDIFQQDITYQAVDDVRDILDEEKSDAVKIGKREEKIEIVKTMFEKKYTLEQIVEVSKFTIEKIKKIKKEMQVDLVKNMLKLSPNEIDEIIKISTLSKKEILKIKENMSK